MTKKRIACPMRHENGNCLPAGGFCTAVNDCICEALHNAFNSGIAALTNELIRQSKEAPAEDVENVVRCKDCEMSRETEDERYLFCMQFADTVDLRAFCSYGKKKEG